MNKPFNAVSVSRARANRLRWWWQQRMGWPAVVAIMLVAGCIVLAVWVKPALDAKRGELVREQVARLDSLARQKAALTVAKKPDWRDQIHNSIPPLPKRGETVAQLLDLASAAGMAMERVEYAVEDQEPNLSRLRVTLPFGGSYAQTRAVIGRVLNGLPNAALDSLDIERPGADTKALEGTMRLSLYFRKDAQ